MSDHVVSTKLKLEDESSSVLHHISEGFEGVTEHVKETAHEFLSFARDAAAVAVGVNISSIADTFKELGEEAFGAAAGVENQVRGLAGMLSISDKTGASIGELREHAAGLKEELEEMSVAAGANSAEVIQGFGEMAERSQHTQEELTHLTESMIYAGRAISGGFGSIAGGFQSMELGMIRASNPVVLLIKQAGLLDGTAKQVAKTLTKMAQSGHIEDVVKLGEEAITRMGEKMKTVAPGFQELTASFHTLREQIFESLGEPVLTAVKGPLEELQHYLIENKEAIHAFAHEAGEKAGEWIVEAAHLFKDGFEYVKDHAEEIKDAISTAARLIKEAFQFVLDHKVELALAFGAGPATRLLGGAASAIGGAVAGAAGAGGGAIGTALAVSEGAGAAARLGAVGSAMASMISPAVALQAAFVGIGLAVNQASKLANEYDDGSKDLAAYTAALKQASTDSSAWSKDVVDHMEEMRQKGLLLASSLGHGASELQAAYDQGVKGHEALLAVISGAQEAAAAVDRIGYLTNDLTNVSPELQAAVDEAADGYGNAVNEAVATHNQAALMAEARLLVGSKNLQSAFIESANLTDAGFQGLIDTLQTLSPELAEKLKGVMGTTPETAKAAVPKTTVNNNFSGGQTFQIKQDFRDQDPDNIAVIFRNDVLKASTNRAAALTGGTYGG